MKFTRFLVLMPVLLLAATKGRAQNSADIADSIRASRGIPGMAWAVFTPDSILETGAVGVKTAKTSDKLRPTDRFSLGTNSAAVTAYLAARLVQAGKIRWSTKLLDIFPEFRKKTFPVYQSITLQDLLASRSRLQPFATQDEWMNIHEQVSDRSIIERRKNFVYTMLQRRPNMDNFKKENVVFSYAGYVAAAAMLEKAGGKTFDELIDLYIRKPLHVMINYSWPNQTDTSATSGHWFQSNSFRAEDPGTWVKLNPILYPVHDMSMSLPGYIRFMQDNLRGLAGKKAALPEEDYQQMFFGLPDYALGWNNGVANENDYAFHEGVSLLFDCKVSLIKQRNRCIIVMGNAGDRDGRGAVLNFSKLLESKYFFE